LRPGPHEFHVPVDSSVESLLFSVSVQCLQAADVVRPSGAPASGDDVTDLSNFRAQRMVIVKRPGAGIWTVLVSGSGVSGIVVQARSPIGIAQVQFAPSESAAFTAVPSAGVENLVRIRVSGHATEIHASLVNAAFRTVTQLPLEAADDGSYVSRFTPGPDGFRVVIAGKDSEGLPFQRVHAPLITPMR
jgi:hypothetical protein